MLYGFSQVAVRFDAYEEKGLTPEEIAKKLGIAI